MEIINDLPDYNCVYYRLLSGLATNNYASDTQHSKKYTNIISVSILTIFVEKSRRDRSLKYGYWTRRRTNY